MIRKTSLLAVAAVLVTAAATPVLAQSPLNFSGTILGNYQVRTDSAAKAANGGQSPNKFDIERVYLTFQMPVGDRFGIRATTDIVQNANGNYYNGWTVRLKYAYLQYNFANDIGGAKGFNALARLGILHNVVIDHEEGFWPRYISPTVTDRFGWMPSADAGVAGLVSLPSKMGEVYATMTNGPGYGSPEVDRFKDFAARASFTPLSSQTNLLKTFTISPWFYKGDLASKFATAAVNPITGPLARNRYGILAGIKDPKLVAVIHWAHRTDGTETGANTAASPVVTTDVNGSALSTYAVVRPIEFTQGKNKQTLGAFFRFDDLKPNTSTAGNEHLVIGGIEWQPTPRTGFSVDYQSLTPSGFSGPSPIVQTKTWYLHWHADF